MTRRGLFGLLATVVSGPWLAEQEYARDLADLNRAITRYNAMCVTMGLALLPTPTS